MLSGARRTRISGTDRSNSMTNTMTYKGYSARIEYDDEDGIFTGRLAGISDGVGFHGDTVDALRDAFQEAVEDYVETCAKVGKEPQKAFSGQVMFRVDPEVHRKAALAAELSGKSLNQWAEEVLGRAAG
jgi:predicted HicB family RNase H-like nuclease